MRIAALHSRLGLSSGRRSCDLSDCAFAPSATPRPQHLRKKEQHSGLSLDRMHLAIGTLLCLPPAESAAEERPSRSRP